MTLVSSGAWDYWFTGDGVYVKGWVSTGDEVSSSPLDYFNWFVANVQRRCQVVTVWRDEKGYCLQVEVGGEKVVYVYETRAKLHRAIDTYVSAEDF